MTSSIVLEIEVPSSLEKFGLPSGVNRRLQELLDRQDSGQVLTPSEREEAEGLVELSEWLSLLRLRARRIAQNATTLP